MKRILEKTIFFVLLFLIGAQVSCSSAPCFQINGLKIISHKELSNAISSYYVAEHLNDWKVTYAYRSYKFRSLVKFDRYSKSMRDSFQGWEMQGVQIESSSCYGSECTVRIKFSAHVDKRVSMKYSKGFADILIHTENTLWRRIGDKWFAIDAGVRGHIPLNANLADN